MLRGLIGHGRSFIGKRPDLMTKFRHSLLYCYTKPVQIVRSSSPCKRYSVLTHGKQTWKTCCKTMFCFWHFRHFINHFNAKKLFHDFVLCILCLFKTLLTELYSKTLVELVTSRSLPPPSLYSFLSVSVCQPKHEVFSSLSPRRPKDEVSCAILSNQGAESIGATKACLSPLSLGFNFKLQLHGLHSPALTGFWLNKKNSWNWLAQPPDSSS